MRESLKDLSLKRLVPKLCMLHAAFVVPLETSDKWQVLKYSKIPPSAVNFSDKGLEMAVKKAAGPVIFPLPTEMVVKRVKIKGQLLNGALKLPEGKMQGDKGADDYLLRLGLVIPGKRTLGFIERQLAPQWMKTLFSLTPKGVGIDHVLFLNVGQQKENLGKSRTHPVSDLLKEKVQWLVTDGDEFSLDADLDQPTKTVAIWLTSGGNDTQSEFTLLLKEIKLTTE